VSILKKFANNAEKCKKQRSAAKTKKQISKKYKTKKTNKFFIRIAIAYLQKIYVKQAYLQMIVCKYACFWILFV